MREWLLGIGSDQGQTRRRRRLLSGSTFAALALAAVMVIPALAATLNLTLEGYNVGTVNGQDGWSSTGAAGLGGPVYDHQVVPTTGIAGFGDRTFRISNAVTDGGFAGQTYTKPLPDEAGEASAANDGKSGGTRQPYFEAEWQFTSAVPGAQQPGLSTVVSPDRGDGARMSRIQMTDTPTGLQVDFTDYQRAIDPTCANPDPNVNPFVTTTVASSLPRGTVHTIKVTMAFVDGIANDVVTTSVDGGTPHVGTSWEDYFRDCESNPTRTVDSLLFRTAGDPAPATQGFGFFVDNIKLTSSALPRIATVFVRKDGSDTLCNGSQNQSANAAPNCAVLTIQKGVERAAPGGTVNVAAGTYAEAVTVTSDAVTITGAGAGQTILEGSNTLLDGIRGAVAINGLTVKDLTIQHYTRHGIFIGEVGQGVDNVTLQRLSIENNGTHGVFLSPAPGATSSNISLIDVSSSSNGLTANPTTNGRGLWYINGAKTNVVIQGGTFNNNRLVGIDISEGSVTALSITGALVESNGDAGIGVFGPQGPGINLVSNNTLNNNGRFGIEVKNPNGSGAETGAGSVVVDGNVVSRTAAANDPRDFAAILVIRRNPDPSINVDQPNGVVIRANEVSGYQNTGAGDGFGIIVEGTAMSVHNNTLTNNEVAIQAQAGNPQLNQQGTDYFDRGNALAYSGVIELNSINATNTIGLRNTGVTAGVTAERNWWGVPNGPTTAANPGNPGTGSTVVGNVDFSPWLGDGTDTDTNARGFQPNLTPLYAVPTKLTFSTPPPAGNEGSPLTPQPVVRAEDAQGNLGINFTGPVALSIAANPENAVLLGNATVNAVGGVATFVNVGISDNGTFTVTANGTLANNTALTAGTIQITTQNVAPQNVTITAPTANAPVVPGQSVQVTATFTDPGTTDTHTCTIALNGGTPVAGTITEPNGNTPGSCTGSVQITGTGPQVIQVTVSDDDGGTAQASVTLQSGAPVLSIADTNVAEGAETSNGTATFTVTLTPATTQPVTVRYQTAAGTATETSDFFGTGGTLTFAPGETTKTIPVQIRGDNSSEPDETFTVTLSNPTNATIGRATATGTILTDDLATAPSNVCEPARSSIVQVVNAGGGRLTVTIQANRAAPNQTNTLESVRFGVPRNAAIEVPNQPENTTGNFTVPLGNGATTFTFSLRRLTAGQAVTVPLTITDSCGPRDTFVGGGVNAF